MKEISPYLAANVDRILTKEVLVAWREACRTKDASQRVEMLELVQTKLEGILDDVKAEIEEGAVDNG